MVGGGGEPLLIKGFVGVGKVYGQVFDRKGRLFFENQFRDAVRFEKQGLGGVSRWANWCRIASFGPLRSGLGSLRLCASAANCTMAKTLGGMGMVWKWSGFPGARAGARVYDPQKHNDSPVENQNGPKPVRFRGAVL